MTKPRIDLRKLLEAGHKNRNERHAEKELLVRGHPRVGTTGVVAADGQVYGTCHRIALARKLGIEVPPDFATVRMWMGGIANEMAWEKILDESKFDGEVLLQDEMEVAIDGVDKTLLGHPDIILRTPDNLETVVELKGIFGYTTFATVFFDRKPKPENLAQLGSYLIHRGEDGILAYTMYQWQKLPFADYKRYVGRFRSVPSQDIIFYVRWNGDTLEYRDEENETWVTSVFTKEGILDYYRLVQEMADTKVLGPRPTSDYADGSTNKYGPCGLCEFSSACDTAEQDYDLWVKRITDISEGK